MFPCRLKVAGDFFRWYDQLSVHLAAAICPALISSTSDKGSNTLTELP